MQIFIIIALVIAVLAVIFALQNTMVVTVTFLLWSFNGSLALVLLFSVLVGVLISLLASLPGLIKGRWSNAGQKKRLTSLEADLASYKNRAETAEQDVKELEEQVANLSAVVDEAQTTQPPAASADQPPAAS